MHRCMHTHTHTHACTYTHSETVDTLHTTMLPNLHVCKLVMYYMIQDNTTRAQDAQDVQVRHIYGPQRIIEIKAIIIIITVDRHGNFVSSVNRPHTHFKGS